MILHNLVIFVVANIIKIMLHTMSSKLTNSTMSDSDSDVSNRQLAVCRDAAMSRAHNPRNLELM